MVTRPSPAVLIAGGAVLLAVGYLATRGGESAGAQVGSGAVNLVVGTFKGVGDAVNQTIIDPAVQAFTGDPNQTLGGWVWDFLHPADAEEMRTGVRPNYSMDWTVLSPVHWIAKVF